MDKITVHTSVLISCNNKLSDISRFILPNQCTSCVAMKTIVMIFCEFATRTTQCIVAIPHCCVCHNFVHMYIY